MSIDARQGIFAVSSSDGCVVFLADGCGVFLAVGWVQVQWAWADWAVGGTGNGVGV